MGYRTKKLDHLGIVAGICERIQLVEQIDSFFPEKKTGKSLWAWLSKP